MTGWSIELRHRAETRSLLLAGWHPATLVTVSLFVFGLTVAVGALLVR